MAPSGRGRKARRLRDICARTGPELQGTSRAQQEDTSPSSHHSSRDETSGGHPRGQASGAQQTPRGDPGPARSASRGEPRSSRPTGEDRTPSRHETGGHQGGPASAARQRPASPPHGVRGPGDALAAARALLQLPPEAVGDAPRASAWVAQLADLVGYAHQETAQARDSSRTTSTAIPTGST